MLSGALPMPGTASRIGCATARGRVQTQNRWRERKVDPELSKFHFPSGAPCVSCHRVCCDFEWQLALRCGIWSARSPAAQSRAALHHCGFTAMSCCVCATAAARGGPGGTHSTRRAATRAAVVRRVARSPSTGQVLFALSASFVASCCYGGVSPSATSALATIDVQPVMGLSTGASLSFHAAQRAHLSPELFLDPRYLTLRDITQHRLLVPDSGRQHMMLMFADPWWTYEPGKVNRMVHSIPPRVLPTVRVFATFPASAPLPFGDLGAPVRASPSGASVDVSALLASAGLAPVARADTPTSALLALSSTSGLTSAPQTADVVVEVPVVAQASLCVPGAVNVTIVWPTQLANASDSRLPLAGALVVTVDRDALKRGSGDEAGRDQAHAFGTQRQPRRRAAQQAGGETDVVVAKDGAVRVRLCGDACAGAMRAMREKQEAGGAAVLAADALPLSSTWRPSQLGEEVDTLRLQIHNSHTWARSGFRDTADGFPFYPMRVVRVHGVPAKAFGGFGPLWATACLVPPDESRPLSRLVAADPRGHTQAAFDIGLYLLAQGHPHEAVQVLEHVCSGASAHRAPFIADLVGYAADHAPALQPDPASPQGLDCFDESATSAMDAVGRWAVTVAWLRLAESDNCQASHTADSCVWPLHAGGRHSKREGMEHAIPLIEHMLSRDRYPHKVEPPTPQLDPQRPSDASEWPAARVWLNVAYQALDRYPQDVPPQWLIPLPLSVNPDSLLDDGEMEEDCGCGHGGDDDSEGGSGSDEHAMMMGDEHGDHEHRSLHASAAPAAFRPDFSTSPGPLLMRTASGDVVPRLQNMAAEAGTDAPLQAGGTLVDDFNGDGALDIVMSSYGTDKQADAARFYAGDGMGGFTELSESTGDLRLPMVSGNMEHADFDNDGWLDIIVLQGGWMGPGSWARGSALLRNMGLNAPASNAAGVAAPTFVNVTAEAGLTLTGPSQAACFGDIDGDGFVDMFFVEESGDPRLFLNNGKRAIAGTPQFAVATHLLSRVRKAHLSGLKGCAFGDYDGDGLADLALGAPSGRGTRLLRSHGRLEPMEDVTEESLAAHAGYERSSHSSFPHAFFDANGDQHPDLVIGSFTLSPRYFVPDDGTGTVLGDHRLDAHFGSLVFINNGDGTFQLVPQERPPPPSDPAPGTPALSPPQSVGLRAATDVMGMNVGDVDGDGNVDVYFGTGRPEVHTVVPHVLARNRGVPSAFAGFAFERDPATGSLLDAPQRPLVPEFEDASVAMGLSHLQKGHGIAIADLDGNGALDVVVNNGGFLALDRFRTAMYMNPGGLGYRWVTVRPVLGGASNTIGVLVRVTFTQREVTAADKAAAGVAGNVKGTGALRMRTLHRTVSTGSSFGGNPLQADVWLGHAEHLCAIEVEWPAKDGLTQRLGASRHFVASQRTSEESAQSNCGMSLDRVYHVTQPTPGATFGSGRKVVSDDASLWEVSMTRTQLANAGM